MKSSNRSLASLTRNLVDICNELGYDTEFGNECLYIYAKHGEFIGSSILERVSPLLHCYVCGTVDGRLYLCVYKD